MEVLVKRRKALRVTFTRSVSKFNEAYDENLEKANALFYVLDELNNKLDAVNDEIFSLMLQEDKTDDEISTELEKEYEYKETFALIRLKVQNRTNQVDESRPEGNNVSSPNVLPVEKQSNRLKLPKVELVKFGGDARDWLHFWSLFQSIHKEPSISAEEKFQYLFQSMIPGSRAYEVVKSFPPTAENYPKALDELKSRFGREGLLVQVYIRELLALVLNNSESGHKLPLMQFYDKLECQLRALESLAVTSDKCACILLPLVESCLPDDLLRAWQRYRLQSSKPEGPPETEERTLNCLRSFIKSEVEGEERISMAKSNFNTGNKKVSPKNTVLKDSSTPTAPCLANKVRETTCIFCSESHKSANCPKAKKMDYNEKRQIVMDKKACFSCLTQGHRAKFCRRPMKCNLCFRKHPAFMCNQANDAAGKSSESNLAEEVKDLSNSHGQSQIYLQTLVVNLVHDGHTSPVRALIDTGSMRSYILKSTVSKIGLSPEGQVSLTHSLFGGVKTSEVLHDEFKIVLGSVSNNYMCRFKVLDQPLISENIPFIERGPIFQELKKHKIFISDVGSKRNIDVLIGADVAGKLFTGKKVQLDCGLMALETFLGWTIMGRMSSTAKDGTCKSEDKPSTVSMFCTTNPSVDSSINRTEGFRRPMTPTYAEMVKRHRQSATDKIKKRGRINKDVSDCWEKVNSIEVVPNDEDTQMKHCIPHRTVLIDKSTTPDLKVARTPNLDVVGIVTVTNHAMNKREDRERPISKFRSEYLGMSQHQNPERKYGPLDQGEFFLSIQHVCPPWKFMDW